jgi:hypothetical protein
MYVHSAAILTVSQSVFIAVKNALKENAVAEYKVHVRYTFPFSLMASNEIAVKIL